MRIVLLSSPENGVIAREENLGSFEGAFYVAEDGQVCHRNRWDARVRIVNRWYWVSLNYCRDYPSRFPVILPPG